MARGKNHPKQRAQAQAANSRRRKKRRTGRKVIHCVLLLVFMLAAGIVLCMTTFFRIEAVTVVGVDKYSPDAIVAASGIELKENMFRVDEHEVEEQIRQRFPYVSAVQVRRKFPPSIELRITQCEPVAAILEAEDTVLIAEDGKVLERGDIFIPAQIPVVKGIETAGAPPGKVLDEGCQEGLTMLNYLFQAVEESEFGSITNVDLTDPMNMTVIYENRYVFLLGSESDLAYKLVFLKEIVQKEPADGEGLIDVSLAKTKRVWITDVSMDEALAMLHKQEYTPMVQLDQPDEAHVDGLESLQDEDADQPSYAA